MQPPSAHLDPEDSLSVTLPSVSEAAPEGDRLVRALEALQEHEHDAAKWLDVALAFRSVGQPIQAIDACEACLKLDPKQVEAWFLIAELADAVGHTEMADDAYEVAGKLAPGDLRLSMRLPNA